MLENHMEREWQTDEGTVQLMVQCFKFLLIISMQYGMMGKEQSGSIM